LAIYFIFDQLFHIWPLISHLAIYFIFHFIFGQLFHICPVMS